MLVLESTGHVLTVTKQQGLEAAAKLVQVLPDGNARSILQIMPAFKTYAAGTIISSGDVVMFQVCPC